MAITFPRDLPPSGLARLHFELQRADLLSPEAGGRLGAVANGFPLWVMRGTLSEAMGEVRSSVWRAWVSSLRGPLRQFYGRDMSRPLPLAYRQSGLPGAFSGDCSGWSVSIAADGQCLISLTGLPAAFVLSMGDYVGFKWVTAGEPRRALVRILEGAVATGGGAATVSVEPAVPSVVPAGAVAYLKDPCCLMRLVPQQTQLGEMDRRLSVGGTIAGLQDLLP